MFKKQSSILNFCLVLGMLVFLMINTQCKKDPLDDLNCGVDIVSFTSEIQSFYPGTDLTGILTVIEDLEAIGDDEIRQMISIYFSSDALYNESDTEIPYIRGPISQDADNADRTNLVWNLTMPFDLAAGNFYLLARIQNQTWVCGTDGEETAWVLPETSSMPITILE